MGREELHDSIESARFIGRVVSGLFNSRKSDVKQCMKAMESKDNLIKVPLTNFDEVIEFK